MPRHGTGPNPTRLQRRLFLERARRLFLDGVEPRGVREEILSSWRRARDEFRLDPGLSRPRVSLTRAALEDRRAGDEALRLATPVLEDFTQRAMLQDHVLAWHDGEGTALWVEGDRAVAASLHEIGLSPGTSWAEPSAGTNGAGTALAARRAIEVFSAEHYAAAWQDWSTAAVPVRVPDLPAPVGVVAMTGRWEVRRRQATTFVLAVARAIEERLRAAEAVRDEVVRYAFRAARERGDALVAVDGHGRILAANDAAARLHVVEGGLLPAAVRDAVVRALGPAAARGDADARLEVLGGAPAAVSVVRYEGARVGAIVRVGAPGAARYQAGPANRPAPRAGFARVLGGSPRLLHAVEVAREAARGDLPVLLAGEPGTGRALLAEAIHAASGRRRRPFVRLDCGSVPTDVHEVALAGAEPGAFGRAEGEAGLLEEAGGGTLLVEELTALAPAAQRVLLRAVRDGAVVRTGGSAAHGVDVRVLASAEGDLGDEALACRFDPELRERLAALVIRLPPLRERGGDVALLARAFLEEADAGRRGLTLSPGAIEVLRTHAWPGNVRQLRGAIAHAAAAAPGPLIEPGDLLVGAGAAAAFDPGGAPEDRPEPERSALVTALDACAWNFRRTAHQLGISRATLYRWCRKHGIARTLQRGPA